MIFDIVISHFYSQGVNVLKPYVTKRRIAITKEDIITVLGEEAPFLHKTTETFQEEMNKLGTYCVLIVLISDEFRL